MSDLVDRVTDPSFLSGLIRYHENAAAELRRLADEVIAEPHEPGWQYTVAAAAVQAGDLVRWGNAWRRVTASLPCSLSRCWLIAFHASDAPVHMARKDVLTVRRPRVAGSEAEAS